jgi:hypothetical protein
VVLSPGPDPHASLQQAGKYSLGLQSDASALNPGMVISLPPIIPPAASRYYCTHQCNHCAVSEAKYDNSDGNFRCIQHTPLRWSNRGSAAISATATTAGGASVSTNEAFPSIYIANHAHSAQSR